MPSPEKAAEGNWCIKQVDGITYIQVNSMRARSKVGHIMEDVEQVKTGRSADVILITFKNEYVAGQKTTLKFFQQDFDSEANALSSSLSDASKKNTKVFTEALTALLDKSANERASATTPTSNRSIARRIIQTTIEPEIEDAPDSRKAMKRRNDGDLEVPDLNALPKQLKANTVDEAIGSHILGRYQLRVKDFKNPPVKWMDRAVDEGVVDQLSEILMNNPMSMSTDQPWVGIADISKSQFNRKEDVKGVTVTIIGGLHRKAAYLKVAKIGDDFAAILKKVDVIVYDNTLSDNEVRRLACTHNLRNKGSIQTSWFQRVVTCRHRLYELNNMEYAVDDTPQSSKEWRDKCKEMYVDADKDASCLEPTLQTSQLPLVTFNALYEVAKMYNDGKLKDLKHRSKPISQNQIAMPLQGLHDNSKLKLLNHLIAKVISIKEFKIECNSIKAKKAVQKGFMSFVGEKEWESVASRFPLHTTEEKLAQFSDLKWSRKGTPEEAANFFRKAVAWEKSQRNNQEHVLFDTDEYVFVMNRGEECAVAIKGKVQDSLIEEKLRSAIPGFDGIKLTLLSTSENCTEEQLKPLLVRLSAINSEMQAYNVVLMAATLQHANSIKGLLLERYTEVQEAWFFDSSPKKMKDYKLQPSIRPVFICNWNRKNCLSAQNMHFSQEEDASNVFCYPKGSNEEMPRGLIKYFIQHLSSEGDTVFDADSCNENAIIECLDLKRNCVLVSGEVADSVRKSRKWLEGKAREVEDDEVDEDEVDEDEMERIMTPANEPNIAI